MPLGSAKRCHLSGSGRGAGLAATSAGRVSASALVQGRGLVVAEAG